MKARSGASREDAAQAPKAGNSQQPPGPVYGLRMRPHKRLFVVLCVIFAAWLVFLLVMYRVSK
jgi:hypothetical protein